MRYVAQVVTGVADRIEGDGMTVLLVEAAAGELILPRLTASSVCSVWSGTSATVLAGMVASRKQTNHLHTQQQKQDGMLM